MNKYINNKKLNLSLLGLVVLSLSIFSLFPKQVMAVPAGCYLGEGNGANTYTPTPCPTQELQRATGLAGACVVILLSGGIDERNCDRLEESDSKLPSVTSPEQACADSGGEWGYVGGGSELGCIGGSSSTIPNDGVSRTDLGENECVGEELNSSNCGIIRYTVSAINLLSGLAGIAIVGSIVFAGYLYMTARDNAGQIQRARQRIIWALVALALFVFMYAFLNWLVPGGVFPV